MTHARCVLVVDDLADARQMLGEVLEGVGFEVAFAADGIEGWRAFACVEPDLVVTDVQMPRLDGIGLVRRIREVSSVPVVMVTAFGSIADCEEAMRTGADRYLELRRGPDRIARVARDLLVSDASQATKEIQPSPDPSKTRATASEMRRLARIELRETLEKLLVECRGNIAEVARRMGRDRSTVRYHLRRMDMLEAPESTHALRPHDLGSGGLRKERTPPS